MDHIGGRGRSGGKAGPGMELPEGWNAREQATKNKAIPHPKIID